MQRSIALALLAAAFVGGHSLVAQAAGDASAIRRATRTEDSRWVSNYRPGSSNYHSGSRSSSYRQYSANAGRSTAAKPSTTKQTAPIVNQSQPVSKAQPVSKGAAR